jgi:ribose 5-phosphate isomerase B
METLSETEIHQIVKRVVEQTVGGTKAVSSQPTEPSPAPSEQLQKPQSKSHEFRTVAIGADHGGFEMKEALKKFLTEKDYPDFAQAVAEMVSKGQAWRGIMIDGAGIGSCMAANKVPGVRAALCYDYATAVNSREHNDANLLTLGAGLIGLNQAKLIAETWLKQEFGGGRHERRVDKIVALEKKYLKDGG